MPPTCPAASDTWIGEVPLGQSIPFDAIRTAGCYVCTWSGHLLRVPEKALVPDGVMNIVGRSPLFVTKISHDPDCSLAEARRSAREVGARIAF